MMTSLMCMRCNEVWSDQDHRCPPTTVETERALEQAVIDAALTWNESAIAWLKTGTGATEELKDRWNLRSAVFALKDYREAR